MNQEIMMNKNRCLKCGSFIGFMPHKCRSVDLKGDRFCIDCGGKLKNIGYERWHNVCPRCNKIRWRNKQRELRKKLIIQFGGKCEICGYNKYFQCLEFHDLNEKSKHKKWHFEKLITENPERFRLLCNRCHREIEIKGGKLGNNRY